MTAYWLDETDGEGTGVGDGDHGYDTSFGPALAYSNLWVNQWLRTFAEPVAAQGEPPLLLTVRVRVRLRVRVRVRVRVRLRLRLRVRALTLPLTLTR